MERTVALDRGDVAILEEGLGGDPLLMVHGFTGAKEDFADHIDALAERGHHVVVPDLRGHGRSFAPGDEGDYGWGDFVADLWQLVDELGWSSCALLGHSFGGMLAQLMVIAEPARIDRLILMSTHHGVVPDLDAELLELGRQVARDQGLLPIQQLLKAGGDPLDNPAYQRLCRERPGYEAYCDAKFLACSPAMYAALLPTFNTADDRLDALGSVTCPTLVMVGELDGGFRDASVRMADSIQGASFEVFANAGHSPQFEAAGAWRSALLGFLAAPRPAGAQVEASAEQNAGRCD